jgi:hypothetical protein
MKNEESRPTSSEHGESMRTADEKRKSDFQLAEYREAANAYFKGVDIGYTGIKSYLAFNALFITAFGLIAADPKGRYARVVADLINVIPPLALVASVVFISVIPHYCDHLRNCLRRCEEIEKSNGAVQPPGLFTQLGAIGKKRKKYKPNSITGAILISVPIVFLWGYLWYQLLRA